MPTTVLLVDDHPVLRAGLRYLLSQERDLELVGEAADGESAIEMARDLAPGVVIMDVSLPGLDGIEATRRILAGSSETKVMALSIHKGRHTVEDMLRAGAAGYVLKESAAQDLVDGVRAVGRGEIYLSPAITDVVVSEYVGMVSGVAGSEPNEDARGPSRGVFVTAKLRRPVVPSGAVSRPRLVEQLNSGIERPLGLVSAPAGYGKTTLVSQWLDAASEQCSSAWLSLDDGDNDLGTFLAGISRAIQTRIPGACPRTSAILRSARLPALPVLAASLANDLDALPERLVLVLDDYHVVRNEVVHGLLQEVLRHPSGTVHLMLLTRADPAIDLESLRAYQKVSELRAQSLCFTQDEAAEFMRGALGASIEPAAAAALTERTEGWVTGLHLVALSASRAADLEDASIPELANRQTLDYLVSEALSRQPREIQRWLLNTSILDVFCGPLCEAVCAPPELRDESGLRGRDFIEWLESHNLFIVPLDDRKKWLRYHHMFRELLLSHLDTACDAEDVAVLHSRASEWLAAAGFLDAAIKHAIDAGDNDRAAGIVVDNRAAVQADDDWPRLKTWLRLLPLETKQRVPELQLAEAWIDLNRFEFSALVSHVERAEALVHPDQQGLTGEIEFFKGYIEYLRGEGELSESHLRRALDLVPEEHVCARAEAELHYALALHMRGNRVLAVRHLAEAAIEGDDVSWQLATRANAGLAFIHMLEADLPQVRRPAASLRRVAERHRDDYADSFGMYMDACVSYWQNDLASAHSLFRRLVDARHVMNAACAVDVMAALVFIAHWRNEPDTAQDTLQMLIEFADALGSPVHAAAARSCRARYSLMSGDLEAAVRWRQSADHEADSGIMLWWLELPRITECRVLLAEGSEASLLEAVGKLDTYAEANAAVHNTSQLIVLGVLKALALQRLSRTDEALEEVRNAIGIAAPGGWIRPFVEAGRPMAGMLTRIKQQSDRPVASPEYLAQILGAFKAPAEAPTARRNLELIEPLTERELQTLRLLATDLSTQEIADELVVTVGTVRTHTKRLYGKLDVHSRYEAILAAQELGLI